MVYMWVKWAMDHCHGEGSGSQPFQTPLLPPIQEKVYDP